MNAPAESHSTYPLSYCQVRLTILWIGSTLVLAAVMLTQVAGGVYGDRGEKALAWLLPNVLPTLGMIGGAIVYQMRQQSNELTVTKFAYRGTLLFSLTYILLILITIVLGPMAHEHLGKDALEWLGVPAAVLTGVSTIVSGALAADSPIAAHVRMHGDGVRDLAWSVEPARQVTPAWDGLVIVDHHQEAALRPGPTGRFRSGVRA